MAKAKASAVKQPSIPTGMFIPCPMNLMRRPVIHPRPVALLVNKGPVKHWVQCNCSFFAYLPRSWQSTWGMSQKEAERAGLLILAAV